MSKKIIEKYFSDKDLKDIASNIDEVEKNTAGEIRLCVHIKKGFFDRKKSAREIAVQQFLKLGMHKTKHRTGVLIYILLDEKKFEILEDSVKEIQDKYSEFLGRLIRLETFNELNKSMRRGDK